MSSTCVWFWGEKGQPSIEEKDYLAYVRVIEYCFDFQPVYVFSRPPSKGKHPHPTKTAVWYVNKNKEDGPVYCAWKYKKWQVAESLAEFLARLEQDYAVSDPEETSVETERLIWLKGRYGWLTFLFFLKSYEFRTREMGSASFMLSACCRGACEVFVDHFEERTLPNHRISKLEVAPDILLEYSYKPWSTFICMVAFEFDKEIYVAHNRAWMEIQTR